MALRPISTGYGPGGWRMSSESPTGYNAAVDLIERNLIAGRGAKTAFIDDRGHYSYAELAQRVNRFANLLRRLGIHPEQRILLCLHDTIDFPTAFLGAIKAGPFRLWSTLSFRRANLRSCSSTAVPARPLCRRRYCRP